MYHRQIQQQYAQSNMNVVSKIGGGSRGNLNFGHGGNKHIGMDNVNGGNVIGGNRPGVFSGGQVSSQSSATRVMNTPPDIIG